MNAALEKALLGRWQSTARDTELGRAVLELRFGPERSVSAAMVFVDDDQRMATSGRYEITEEGFLVTEVLQKGQPLKLDVSTDVLILDDGEEAVRYTRCDEAKAT